MKISKDYSFVKKKNKAVLSVWMRRALKFFNIEDKETLNSIAIGWNWDFSNT